jgi:hypothetical protein
MREKSIELLEANEITAKADFNRPLIVPRNAVFALSLIRTLALQASPQGLGQAADLAA